MHWDATLNEATGVLTRRNGQRMNCAKFVLLPFTGINNAAGEPVHMGDSFARTVDGKVETFIVGPLPQVGVVVKAFELVGCQTKSGGKVIGKPETLPLTAESLATLTRREDVFANPELFVPQHTPYCYHSLGWSEEYLLGVGCPFWQRSDHGLVYCRLRQLGSLTDEAGERSDEQRRKALAHFGTQDAVDAADQVGLLWDQVKCCGISDDFPDEPE
jgi:hypothetical protein